MIDSFRFTSQQQISFQALTPDIQRRLIALGVPLLVTETEGRLALAERKIASFERKYHTTLAQLHQDGLPDDASMEMHEDFVEWSGWQATQAEAVSLLALLPSSITSM
jgi:hypothetical protein